MLPALYLKGSPSRTVPSAPTLKVPRVPALKLSPSLPVMVPSIRAFAAYAAR
jgi:hypothetical protein